MDIHYREISREELSKLEELDRTEYVDYIYKYDDGSLVKSPLNITIPKWSSSKKKEFIENITNRIVNGGKAFGAFDKEKLVGVSVLGEKTWGNTAQLTFLHVSSKYRKQGIGRKLIELIENEAVNRGYRSLYVSATESVSTVNFYMNYGFRLAKEVIKELYEEEPDDIHMTKDITKI